MTDSPTYKGRPVKIEPFMAFESVGKPDFKLGTVPPHSHLICFWKVRLDVKAEDIPLKLCIKEVGAALWLPPDIARGLLS